MTDFKVKVTAETEEAKKQLKAVDETAKEATKARQIKIDIPGYQDLTKNFRTLKSDVEDAANSISNFYRVASKLPVGPIKDVEEFRQNVVKVSKAANDVRKDFLDAGEVVTNSVSTAKKSVDSLLYSLVKVGVAMYALQSATNAVSSAFSSFFNNTIGREAALRATILKTQTTLASTSKVFKNGAEITDPFQKIVTLTGAVRKNIDSIRERSIELAGVTSNEVIEVFGIVAGQIGQIGGGLKEAEDLAINFAAALGTFGLPLYQARQEIGSILRGDITMDSYLAKSLGITNEDIAKAKTQAGGVVKFLENRLAAAVAGQKIAAMGLAGVVSNIRDISELIGQNFGSGMLDPLISGLTEVFNFLFGIRERLFEISRLAGKTIGGVLAVGIGKVSEASQMTPKRTEIAGAGLQQAENMIKRIRAMLLNAFDSISGQIAGVFDRLTPALATLTQGVARLAEGLISIKLEQLKALISLVNSLAPAVQVASTAVSGFFNVWAGFMELPLVQYLSQISAGMRLLEISGFMPLIKNAIILVGVLKGYKSVVATVVVQFNHLRTIIGGVILSIGRLVAASASAVLKILAAWAPTSKAFQSAKHEIEEVARALQTAGQVAQSTGNRLGGLGVQVQGVGAKAKQLIWGFVKFNVAMFLLSAAISAVTEGFGQFQEAQEKAASTARAEQALQRLRTVYRNVGDSASETTKRAAAFDRQLNDSQFDQAVERLEKIRRKLEEIKDLTDNNKFDLGKGLRQIVQTFNPANFDAFVYTLQNLGNLPRGADGKVSFASVVELLRKRDLKRAESEVNKWGSAINEIAKQDQIAVQAANLTDRSKEFGEARMQLERDIADYRRGIENELFQARQRVTQKEIEIFRAAGELRIFQMEQANAKLLEGQEGASRASIEALNEYLKTREEGELDIETQKKNIQIEVANLEKAVSDYRYEQERRIVDMRKAILEYEKKVAQYRTQMASVEAQARAADIAVSGGGRTGDTGLVQGNTGTSSSGDHFHVGGAASEAEARAIFANSKNLALTDVPGSPRDGGTRSHQGYDLAGPVGTKLVLAAGYSLSNFTRDPNGKGGNYATVVGPNGKAYQVMHLKDPGPNWSMSGGTQNGGATAGTDFRTRYLKRLSNLEGGYGIKGSAAYNRESGALGYFQLLPSTEVDLWKRGKGSIADKLASKDFATAAQGAYEYAVLQRPAVQQLFTEGDVAGLDRLLNRLWTSLPGGREAATGARLAAGNAYLEGGSSNSAPGNVSLPFITPPAAPVFSSDDLGGVKRYTEAVKNLQQALERFRVLQEALTEAKSKAAFDNISKAMFPQVELEQYSNQIEEARLTLKALAQVSEEAYDPELLSINVEHQKELNIKAREQQELLADATAKNKAKLITDAELLSLRQDLSKREQSYVLDLEKQTKLKKEQLELTRQQTALARLSELNSSLKFDSKAELLRTQADSMRSFIGDDPVKQRLLEAEIKVKEYSLQLERDKVVLTEDVMRKQAQYAEQIRANAVALGVLEKRVSDFNGRLTVAKDAGKTFSDSTRSLLGDLIRGQKPQEAMSTALSGFADKFLGMFLDYAMSPVDKMYESIFKDLFGVQNPVITAQAENTNAIKDLTTAITTKESLSTGNSYSLTSSANASNFFPISFTDLSLSNTGFVTEMGTAFKEVIASTKTMTSMFSDVSNSASPLPQQFSGFQKTLGGISGIMGSIGMGFAGISQMKKGGAYNTLMGLAGVFGAISGVVAPFTPKGIFGGKFASGGQLQAGKFGLVGEHGPELIYSGNSVNILSNDRTTALFRDTRSALSSQRNSPKTQNLRSDTGSRTIDIRYESQVINKVEYVTAEQHRKGMREAAQMGQALAYQGLQNSVPTRRRLGF